MTPLACETQHSGCFSWVSTDTEAAHRWPDTPVQRGDVDGALVTASDRILEFQVEAETMWGQRVAVCGSTPALGQWDPTQSLVLSADTYPVWRGTLMAGPEPISFSYVLVKVDQRKGTRTLIRWEECERRELHAMSATERISIKHHFEKPLLGTVAPTAEAQKVSKGSKDLQSRGSLRASLSTAASSTMSNQITVLQASSLSTAASSSASNQITASQNVTGASADKTVLESLAAEEAKLENSPHRRKRLSFTRCVASTKTNNFDLQYKALHSKVLGKGGMCGNVYMAVRRHDLVEVAVKELPVKCMKNQQVMSEVRNHMSLSHPNICNLLQVFEESSRVYVVMERLRGPDLHEYWHDRGRLREQEAANFMRQISSAVEYCHSEGVCHRDLKLENICMDKKSADACLKLIDFGLSVDITEKPELTGIVGSLYYMAPEVWQSRYSEKCDMWSLGVIAYLLLDGRPPFDSDSENEIVKLICSGEYRFREHPWKFISNDAQDFVSSLLQVDAGKRLDARGGASHRWLTSFDKTAQLESAPQEPQADI
mmetsp:Transcript_57148/g.107412  ORF Transcript_57148/g.107412 Transcript_57148/m.107412 type:complete len:543 (+) Transcript_57148:61-1689(+)